MTNKPSEKTMREVKRCLASLCDYPKKGLTISLSDTVLTELAKAYETSSGSPYVETNDIRRSNELNNAIRLICLGYVVGATGHLPGDKPEILDIKKYLIQRKYITDYNLKKFISYRKFILDRKDKYLK